MKTLFASFCFLLFSFFAPVFAEEQICTLEYAPVCGEVEVQCITTPCDPVQETFGNRCQLETANAKFLYEGECSENRENISENCVSWFDGCNTCTVENGEIEACTKMDCEIMEEPYCKEYNIPKNCTSWFDGCNTCGVEDGELTMCTLMYCENPVEPECRAYEDDPVVCTADVKECPDGSFVSRNPAANCAFPACPEEDPEKTLFLLRSGDVVSEDFIFALEDEQKIEAARDIMSQKENKNIIIASIILSPASYNPDWKFHIKPSSVELADMAPEVCDATPSLVEYYWDDIGDSVLPDYLWCPWDARVVAEFDDDGSMICGLDKYQCSDGSFVGRNSENACSFEPCPETIQGQSDDEQVCTTEYNPVCGEVEVQCITAPCDPVKETFGNRCMLDASEAKFLYEGECTIKPRIPENCTSWFDGCNTCTVKGGELIACTEMACNQYETPECRAYKEEKPCTREYMPVCGQPPMPECPPGMACAQVMPSPETYSNACVMENAGAELLHERECAQETVTLSPEEYSCENMIEARKHISEKYFESTNEILEATHYSFAEPICTGDFFISLNPYEGKMYAYDIQKQVLYKNNYSPFMIQMYGSNEFSYHAGDNFVSIKTVGGDAGVRVDYGGRYYFRENRAVLTKAMTYSVGPYSDEWDDGIALVETPKTYYGHIVCPIDNPLCFPDVDESTKFAEAIGYVKKKGYVEGFGDGLYRPEHKISRYEFIKIVVSTKYSDEEVATCDLQNDLTFPDVPKDEWFSSYVCIAQRDKIVKGFASGEFGGTHNVTSTEALKILLETYEIDISSYEDGEAWYGKYQEAAKDLGLTDEVTDAPDVYINRSEMAELIYQIEQ